MRLNRFSIFLVFLFEIFCRCSCQFWTYIPVVNYVLKNYYEVCDDDWISPCMQEFKGNITKNVFGQPLLMGIADSVSAHFARNPKKALVLSFHGWPGSGKNFVADFLVNSIFKKGTKSLYSKYYNGRLHFPLQSEVVKYQEKLRTEITEAVGLCPKSVFVFDEVDMMPYKVLDALHPFIDYQTDSSEVDARKSIFIFISNRGGNDIADLAMASWKKGEQRSELKLSGFQNAIRQSAFSQAGGFQHCDNINSHLISYYVPFLPLDKSHVIQCIKTEFHNHGKRATTEQIDEVLSQVPFTPKESPSAGMFASSGCKNIDTYVSTLIETELRKKRKKEEL